MRCRASRTNIVLKNRYLAGGSRPGATGWVLLGLLMMLTIIHNFYTDIHDLSTMFHRLSTELFTAGMKDEQMDCFENILILSDNKEKLVSLDQKISGLFGI